jgi:hypothetical protein
MGLTPNLLGERVLKFMNHYQAIILALEDLGGEGTIKEVNDWIHFHYPNTGNIAGPH